MRRTSIQSLPPRPVRGANNNFPDRSSRASEFYGGFDLSLTASGIVILDKQGEVAERHIIKPKTRGAERLHDINEAVRKIITPYSLKMVCIEGYAMGVREGQLASLGELGGVIRLLLHHRTVPYHTPTPNQLKKFATGLGVGEKDIVMMHVYKNWKFQAVDNNEADAYVLARIAMGISGININTTKAQREVIETVLNPPVKKKKNKKEN